MIKKFEIPAVPEPTVAQTLEHVVNSFNKTQREIEAVCQIDNMMLDVGLAEGNLHQVVKLVWKDETEVADIDPAKWNAPWLKGGK